MVGLIYGLVCFLVVILSFVILHYFRKSNDDRWNFPIVGIIPMLLKNFHCFHDYTSKILGNSGGTFILKDPSFSNLKLIATCDPTNVHHITTSKFSNYIKGEGWKKRFDIFGSALLNSDFEDWKIHRGIIRGFLSHKKFQQLLPKVFEDSMNKKLIPSLEHVCKQEVPVDFGILIKRHIFYISFRIAIGCDTTSSHEDLLPNAIANACEAILARHIFPESLWKLQKWLGLGLEGKLYDAWRTIDNVLAEQIYLHKKRRIAEEEIDFNFLEFNLTESNFIENVSIDDSLTRDNLLNLLFALGDTTSTTLTWFFWLLLKHPIVENKIRQEIQNHFQQNEGAEMKWLPYGAKEFNKLVYLHAALCETLRLFPPVPFESRTSIQDDILPSGHKINGGENIIISTYAMGRMTSIWGDDCHEFKPERWIADNGVIKHVASHKFFAFMSGPRICLGKDVGFSLMKATASAIIHNYHIQAVESQAVNPKVSIILHMKQGLMVTLDKRCHLP